MDASLQLTSPTTQLNSRQKLGLGLVAGGLLFFLIAWAGAGSAQPVLFFWLGFGLITIGSLVYFWEKYMREPAGIKNNGLKLSSSTTRGAIGWILGIVITGGYVLLYWFPNSLKELYILTDPLSRLMTGKPGDQWFFYGFIYTLAVVVMGVRAIMKYRHSPYQILRTLSVMFFQFGFAFTIPALLKLFQQPEFYFSYFWPLKYQYLWPGNGNIGWIMNHPGGLGVFMIFWGAIMSFIGVPILTYFFGKRWYCSWVCGCGGLAETAGDPFRQMSDKSLNAWRIERWMIHGVLVFVVVTTLILWINSATEGGVLGSWSGGFSKTYGFLIGSVFSGVVGVGFYPLMGSRVWCRFGCPLAAILGIIQKYFSRFRITTNGGQCISCGNCSTYCEMGIDVRWYAQRGQNIVRASCVGCGVCSAVCPRGVLNLEAGPVDRKTRYNEPAPVLISADAVDIL